MCQEAGVLLEFLPPYSPDFNPIEEAFAEQYVRNPNSGELVKGHAIVLAELGLVT